MSSDNKMIDEYLIEVIERFDVYDLVELLGLTAEQVAEKFYDEIIESAEVRAALRM